VEIDGMATGLTETLSLKAAYEFGIQHGLNQQVDDIRNMVIEWDNGYTSSLRRGYIVQLFDKSGILNDFKSSHWPYGLTPAGEKKEKFYLRIKKRYEEFLAGTASEPISAPVEHDEEADQAFAAESDLRDFLAKNLACIEPGLSLFEQGVEFAVENGFIDILCVDKAGQFVVIELKVGRGRNKTIGQLLYYMGWVDKNLGKAPCRGMIIAKDIPVDLQLAVKRVPGVSILRYHLAVSLEPIQPK
jgi:hypothetical protein